MLLTTLILLCFLTTHHICLSSASQSDVTRQDSVNDAVHRQKRDIYDSGDVPYDLFDNDRDRRTTDRRFDPFLFGSSDRFSHGFGKRSTSSSAAMALRRLLYQMEGNKRPFWTAQRQPMSTNWRIRSVLMLIRSVVLSPCTSGATIKNQFDY